MRYPTGILSTLHILKTVAPLIADQTFAPKWITDLSMNYTFTNELNIAFGVSNLLDVYPDRLYMDPNNRQDNLSSDPMLNYNSSAARDHTANGRIPFSRNVTQFGLTEDMYLESYLQPLILSKEFKEFTTDYKIIGNDKTRMLT